MTTTTTTTSTTAEAGPSSSAAGKAVVPSLARVNTIEMEELCCDAAPPLSVLCGEDPADILACVSLQGRVTTVELRRRWRSRWCASDRLIEEEEEDIMERSGC